MTSNSFMGLFIKYVRSQGREGIFQCGYFADKEGGGSSDENICTLFCKNKIGFFKIYSVSARTRGEVVEPARKYCGQGEGKFS